VMGMGHLSTIHPVDVHQVPTEQDGHGDGHHMVVSPVYLLYVTMCQCD
jgi:hypothetical protein